MIRKEDVESLVQHQEEEEDEAPPPSPQELQYVRDIKRVSFISCLLTILLLFLFFLYIYIYIYLKKNL
jgi:hypothetical protein